MQTRFLGILVAVALSIGCEEEGTSAPSPAVRLVEAGWSFGFCLGPCNGTLLLDGDTLDYRVRNREGDQVLASAEARLTSSGSARLASLVAGLPEALRDVYGCPDCADAGAAYVVLSREGMTRRSNYEYPSPTVELAALDSFLKSVMDALGRCASTPDVTITGSCSPAPR